MTLGLTKRKRRDEIRRKIRRGEEINTPDLAEHFDVSVRVILRDLQILHRSMERDAVLKHRGRSLERLAHLSYQAEQAGQFGDAIRAEAVIAKISGSMPGDVTVNTSATANATTQVTTFAELSRRAVEHLERSRAMESQN